MGNDLYIQAKAELFLGIMRRKEKEKRMYIIVWFRTLLALLHFVRRTRSGWIRLWYTSGLTPNSINAKAIYMEESKSMHNLALSDSSQLRFAGARRKRQAIDPRASDDPRPRSSLLRWCWWCPLRRIDSPIHRLRCRDFAHGLMIHETSSVLIGFAALVADEGTRLLRPVLAMRHARSMVVETSWCCVRFAAFFTGVRTWFLIP